MLHNQTYGCQHQLKGGLLFNKTLVFADQFIGVGVVDFDKVNAVDDSFIFQADVDWCFHRL